MSISSLITDIYNNLLKFNNTNIIVLFDESRNIWFSYNELLNAIGYKDAKTQRKRIQLDGKYFDTFKNIYSKSSLNKFDKTLVSHRVKMISESGMFLILSKSNKDNAKQLMEKLYTDVLPSLRKSSKFILDKSEKKEMNKLTKKVVLYQQQLQFTKKQSYNNTTGKGFIYILEINTPHNGKESICYKIGYTANLEKRMNTYKTGNPNIKLVHHENINCNKKQLEKCVINLNYLKLLKNKTEVICNVSLDKLKEEFNDCKQLLNKHSGNK